MSFTSWSALLDAETTLGTSSTLCLALVNASTGAVILRRAVVDGAWRLVGMVDLTAVTPTPHGVVQSVDSLNQLTLAAPHTLTSGLMGLLDVSAAAELAYGVPGSVDGNVVTLPDTTGAQAGDLVYRSDVSELPIGNASRVLSALAGGFAVFSGAYGAKARNAIGELRLGYVGDVGNWVYRFRMGCERSAAESNQRWMVGVVLGAGQAHIGFGQLRGVGGDALGAQRNVITAPTIAGGDSCALPSPDSQVDYYAYCEGYSGSSNVLRGIRPVAKVRASTGAFSATEMALEPTALWFGATPKAVALDIVTIYLSRIGC